MLFIFAFLISGQMDRKNFSLLNYFDGEYYAYSATQQPDGINLGCCYMTKSKNVKNKTGESMVLYNFEVGNAIKTLQAKVIKTECLSTGATVIYTYSDSIPTSIKLDDKAVNLQFACYDDHCVVGWPIIIGSF